MPTYADLVGPELASVTGIQAPAPFSCLRVSGPDAVGFLQRLCTQDVAAMAVGTARPGAFLTPKGRLETLVWLGLLDGEVWLETQAHERAKLAALLDRYHFSERLRIEVPEAWTCWQLLGPAAWGDGHAPGIVRGGDGTGFAGECRGLRWLRWHGHSAPPFPAGLPALDDAHWQRVRIAAGLPWLGVDADASHIALELDLDDHVSLTKGCYTGQEIVARIHTYGHTNRRLCRVRVEGDAGGPPLPVKDADGEPVGRITSLAGLPGGASLGLAVLPHAVAAPGTALVVGAGPARAEVC
jgi:folate-binding protein YgfZ